MSDPVICPEGIDPERKEFQVVCPRCGDAWLLHGAALEVCWGAYGYEWGVTGVRLKCPHCKYEQEVRVSDG